MKIAVVLCNSNIFLSSDEGKHSDELRNNQRGRNKEATNATIRFVPETYYIIQLLFSCN